MKLISCHVENFGKLSDLNMNFSEGINIINQPNGWGKSTLAAFFRAMLYGFDNKKEPGALDKERRIYRPWQGGIYGGELDFEIGDKQYRISRTFGTTEKTDEFYLYDLATNLECDDFSENIGEEIFDIDRNSFRRSILIAQNDCGFETSDSINAKLGNLVENTNDINNYESAQRVLKDMMNKLSPDRVTGSLKKRKNIITTLTQDIRSFDAAQVSANQVKEKYNEKKSMLQELQSIRQEYSKALQIASEDSRRRELRSSYDALCDDEKEKKAAFSEYEELFPKELPQEQELVSNIDKARKMENLSAAIESLKFEDEEDADFENYGEIFEVGQPSEEQLQEMLQNAENITKVKEQYGQLAMKLSQMESIANLNTTESPADDVVPKSKKTPAGLFIIIVGITIAVLSVFALFSFKEAGIVPLVGMGVGAVCILMGITFMAKGNKANKENELAKIRKIAEYEQNLKEKEEPIQELREELEQIQAGVDVLVDEVEAFLADYKIECEVVDFQKKLYELQNDLNDYCRLLDKKKQFMEAVKQSSDLEAELKNYSEIIGIEFEDDVVSHLNFLKTKISEYKLTQKNYENSLDKKKQFEDSHDMENVLANDECPYGLDELNNLISEVDERTEEVRAGVEQYARQLEDLQEQLDLRDEKVEELNQCQELQDKESRKFEVLKLTQEYLTNAKESFTANYMAPISRGFSKYYEILTEDESRNWVVDANIDVKIKEQGELRETKWLSAGYQDLIGVCMRLALVDAMYPEEKPFLILDDPFVNLDDERLDRGKDLLLNLDKEYQAIYFTCHESREYR